MNCWIIGVTFMCANGFGPAFVYNYNQNYAAPTPRITMTYEQWQDTYRKVGWQTDREYFCRGQTHSMDAKLCK